MSEPARPEERESGGIEETVVEVMEIALGTVSAILGKAGDFGAASRDDGIIYRKRKKKAIRKIR